MRIVEAQDTLYLVLKTYPVNIEIGYEELKKRWGADTILRNKDILYLCARIIDAEFEMVPEKKIKKK